MREFPETERNNDIRTENPTIAGPGSWGRRPSTDVLAMRLGASHLKSIIIMTSKGKSSIEP